MVVRLPQVDPRMLLHEEMYSVPEVKSCGVGGQGLAMGRSQTLLSP